MKQELYIFSNAIELLRRRVNKDLPSQHIALLLAVAMQPGITMTELCTQLDMPQGSVSRNVKLMSHFCANSGTKVTKNGYGLLKTDQAEVSRYRLSVFLTAEGERLVQKLAQVVGHENVDNPLFAN
jgi:hypothetical protein